MHRNPDRAEQRKRLARIRGQIDGIARMLDEDRPCTEVLTQLRAAHAALRKVEEALLRQHATQCLAEAMTAPAGGAEKIDALLDVLSRYGR